MIPTVLFLFLTGVHHLSIVPPLKTRARIDITVTTFTSYFGGMKMIRSGERAVL